MANHLTLPQSQISSQLMSSIPPSNPWKNFIFKAAADLVKEASLGCITYGGLWVARRFSWIKAPNLHPAIYVGAFFGTQLIFTLVELTYLVACKTLGPREKYMGISSANFATKGDKIRAQCWKRINQLEQKQILADKIFCRILNKCKVKVRTLEEIRVKQISDRELTEFEKVRKVFWGTIKECCVRQAHGQTLLVALQKLNGYLPITPLKFLATEAFFFFQLQFKVSDINKRIEAELEAEQHIKKLEQKYYLPIATNIDLRNFQDLNPIVLEKLLAKCPRLEILQLNVSDLPRVQTFNTMVRSDIQVQLFPIASSCHQILQNEKFSKLANGNVECQGKQLALHSAIIGQFPVLKYGFGLMNRKGELNKVDISIDRQQEFMDWIQVAYQGTFPLYKLNGMANELQRRTSLVNNPLFSDFNLIFKVDDRLQKIPVHRALLLARSEYFQDLLFNNENNKDGQVELDCSQWKLESVLQALQFMYDGVVDIHEVEDLDSLMQLALEWKINGLKIEIEKQLISSAKKIHQLEKITTYQQLVAKYDLSNETSTILNERQKELDLLTQEELRVRQVRESKDKAEIKQELDHAKEENLDYLLQECYLALYVKDKQFDCQLSFKKGKQLAIHKDLLAERSPHFKEVFSNPEVLGKSNTLLIEEDREMVVRVIQLIYGQKLDKFDSLEDFKKFIDLIEKWQLDDLKNPLDKAVADFIAAQNDNRQQIYPTTIQGWEDFKNWASDHHLQKIKMTCQSIIDRQTELDVINDIIGEMNQNHVENVKGLLRHVQEHYSTNNQLIEFCTKYLDQIDQTK